MTAVSTPALAIAAARRIVVKIGSSLIISAAGAARTGWLESVAADLAALRAQGKELIVVTSGAVALGRSRLGLGVSARLDQKQAAAAAGQTMLMQAWEAALAPHQIPTAQMLLTFEDTERRRRWLNARATLAVLLAQGALPVINENDSVATDELRYGDNDRLSARVAQMACAELLILLSDVDGLYTSDPVRDPAATHLAFVDELSPQILSYAGAAAVNGLGSGGMRTKLAAAQIARSASCATIIASGRSDHPLAGLSNGHLATLITAPGTPARAYKQWIAGSLAPTGTVVIDRGAVAALAAGRSLLPAGVVAVKGEFEKGSCVSIQGLDGGEVARGIARYNSVDAATIAGLPSGVFESRLGYCGSEELIHRDDLAMVTR